MNEHSACVTSMIRLKYILAFGNSYDSTCKHAILPQSLTNLLTFDVGDDVDVVIWSMIEEHTAVICCCLPSLRPLLVRWIPGVFKSATTGSGAIGSSNYRMGPWRP